MSMSRLAAPHGENECRTCRVRAREVSAKAARIDGQSNWRRRSRTRSSPSFSCTCTRGARSTFTCKSSNLMAVCFPLACRSLPYVLTVVPSSPPSCVASRDQRNYSCPDLGWSPPFGLCLLALARIVPFPAPTRPSADPSLHLVFPLAAVGCQRRILSRRFGFDCPSRSPPSRGTIAAEPDRRRPAEERKSDPRQPRDKGRRATVRRDAEMGYRGWKDRPGRHGRSTSSPAQDVPLSSTAFLRAPHSIEVRCENAVADVTLVPFVVVHLRQAVRHWAESLARPSKTLSALFPGVGGDGKGANGDDDDEMDL